MILNKPGQGGQYGPSTFTVGDISLLYGEPNLATCGFIKEINVCDASCPTALCDFGEFDKRVLPLRDLDVLTVEEAVETGRQYVLHCARDGEEGQNAHVLGVSDNKNVLVHLMLEDVKKGPEMGMTFSCLDEKGDSICFSYESNTEELYTSYSIAPVTVYSKAKENAV